MEAVVAYSRYYSDPPGQTQENHERPKSGSLCPLRNAILTHKNYNSERLLGEPTCWL
jgi:hypothetical protein